MECYNCGRVISESNSRFCPYCGYRLSLIPPDTLPPYSGTISTYASGCVAHEQIGNALETYYSLAESYPETSKIYAPVIDEIKKVKEITLLQDEKIAELERTQSDFSEFNVALKKYKELVDNFEEEPIYQNYLKDNPNIFNLQVKTSFPKFNLSDELIPDFLLILHDSTHLFVEIEKPAKNIFTADGSERAEFRTALKQVRDFVTWAGDELAFLRKRECPKINQNNIRGLLVIGHSSNLSEDDLKRLERINFEYKGLYLVKTFDQLYYDRMSELDSIGWHWPG